LDTVEPIILYTKLGLQANICIGDTAMRPEQRLHHRWNYRLPDTSDL